MLSRGRKNKQSAWLYLVIVLINALFLWALATNFSSALTLQQRSLQVSSGLPSATSTHTFQFTYASTTPVGSIVFEYCENSPVFSYACNAPVGLDVSAATLGAQTGNVGFAVDSGNTTANKLVLTRVSAAAVSVASSYTFNSVTNPSTAQSAEYVRISTHASTDGTGPLTDNGAVAFATIQAFNVDAVVPPFLRFCVGLTVAPDCSGMSGDSIDLGNLSSKSANAGQSQFATGTNSDTGYIVFALGTTMTSGNNVIPALTSPSSNSPGTSQFGINLRANSNPSIGQDPIGAGPATVTGNYNSVNLFAFNSGDSVVSSSAPSDYNRMTVSYLVNVNSNQTPGVYSTTLTYLATGQF